MYETVWHAIGAMVRWREIRGGSRGLYVPDEPHGATAGEDPGADALTVEILFARYDRRGALTRLYFKRHTLDDFGGRERRLARKARNHFIRELCHRGLLAFQGDDKSPQKWCPGYVHGECPRFQRQDWAGKEFS